MANNVSQTGDSVIMALGLLILSYRINRQQKRINKLYGQLGIQRPQRETRRRAFILRRSRSDFDDLDFSTGHVLAYAVKGKGRFNKVETYRRVFVRFDVVGNLTEAEAVDRIRLFYQEATRSLRLGTNTYMQRRTPSRTGRLRKSYESGVVVSSTSYVECRYNPDHAYYARWVPRVADLLSSDALLRRMRKAIKDGAKAAS